MRRGVYFLLIVTLCLNTSAQVKWINVDSNFRPLPKNFHVYQTKDSLDGKPFVAYYAEAKLKDKQLQFTTDSTFQRRLTPLQFYNKNNKPLLVVNGTFFSFTTNQNLNALVKNGELIGYNIHAYVGRGKDTLTFKHPLGSALGISKKRKADVAWLLTDSSNRNIYALQHSSYPIKDSSANFSLALAKNSAAIINGHNNKNNQDFKKWKVKTAIGGGPVLLQNGKVAVSNNEELKFTGKAINDMHPRTCMGYTKNGKLIIMVIQGRSANSAGASLNQEAKLLMELGCVEALNLDGGGSSTMLINGKETIKPSDKEGQRAVPGVFIIVGKL